MSLEDETIFHRDSDVELTRREHLRHVYDQYVRAPFTILLEDWRTLLGMAIIGTFALMGTVGVWLVQSPSSNQVDGRWVPPLHDGWVTVDPATFYGVTIPAWPHLHYPLGSNSLGMGELELLVHSTPAMFEMVIAGAGFTVVVGTIVGTTAGYLGGRIDALLSTLSDIMMTIPGLPLIIVVAQFVELQDPWLVGLILAFNAWAALARQIRSEVLSMRQLGYIKASKTMGLPTYNILAKDVVPNLMSYITVNFVRSGRNLIFASVALYFLGVLPFSNENWGVMLNLAFQNGALIRDQALHTLLIPMFGIVFFSLGLTLLAQGTDRMFNPRVRVRHAKTIDDSGPME